LGAGAGDWEQAGSAGDMGEQARLAAALAASLPGAAFCAAAAPAEGGGEVGGGLGGGVGECGSEAGSDEEMVCTTFAQAQGGGQGGGGLGGGVDDWEQVGSAGEMDEQEQVAAALAASLSEAALLTEEGSEHGEDCDGRPRGQTRLSCTVDGEVTAGAGAVEGEAAGAAALQAAAQVEKAAWESANRRAQDERARVRRVLELTHGQARQVNSHAKFPRAGTAGGHARSALTDTVR
jgi:hypothetical protein